MTKTLKIAAVLVAAVLVLTGCDGYDEQKAKDDKQSSATFAKQSKAQPYPGEQLVNSLERSNLRQRLLRENKANQIRYVYLLGDTGTYIGYFTIKGKVSSNQSQMLQQDDISRPCGSCDRYVVDGPGDDGSYGEDAEGQFFFTTEGVMVSTDMRYIVMDSPLSLNVPKLNQPK